LTVDQAHHPERVRRAGWEALYANELEPWTYSARAAEVLRHEHLEKTVRSLRPRFQRILDVGCSVGQLTSRLVGAGPSVHALDVSPTAVLRAEARCRAAGDAHPERPATRFSFYVASSLDPPFRDAAFDLVMMCDGIHSWRLTPEEQARVLGHAHRLLVPGGFAILTDHLKPRDFRAFVERVRASPLEVLKVRYLHNRLWYSLERSLARFRARRAVRKVLASRTLARGLMLLSSLAGRRGAKHLLVVARRPPEGASR
jgi:SAM-dependent methyltransferase